MTQNNLIHDILNHLTANPKTMERFNNITEDYPIYNANICEFFDELATLSGKKHFIMYALSSPNGVPICNFLAGENPALTALIKSGFTAENKEYNLNLYKQTPKTISTTLYRTLCDCIEQGMNFSRIEQVLNDKYNELLCPE